MDAVFHPLPRGARDFGPEAARLRRALTKRVLDTSASWGYLEVSPPVIEYFDVLSRGLSEADERRCVRFAEAGSGRVVSLRSDVTPQVARMVAQGRGSVLPELPVRLSYAAALVRRPDRGGGQTELHQVGLELVGLAEPWADAEVLALMDETLTGLGLSDFRLDIAHVGVVSAALEGLGLGVRATRLARASLARKDRGGLHAILIEAGVDAPRREATVSLCALFGPPAILERARVELAPLAAAEAGDGSRGGIGVALARLEAVLKELHDCAPAAHARVLVDLGEPRGFDYYTGLRLRVWAPGVPEPIARGGRYDELVGAYGAPAPAVGMAIDLDSLEKAVAAQSLEIVGAKRRPLTLVAGGRQSAPTLTSVCREIRARGERACLASGCTTTEGLARAKALGATTLVVVAEDGTRTFRAETNWIEESRQ